MNFNRKKMALCITTGAVLAGTLSMGETAYAGQTKAGLNAGVTAAITGYIDDSTKTAVEEKEAAKKKAEEEKAAEEAKKAAEEQKKAEEPEVICGYTNLGVANVDSILNVRKEPSEEAELAGKMPANAGCEILEQAGEWYKIQSGKVTGYVKAEFLLTGDEAKQRALEKQTTIATVTTVTLYVREQPNTDCKIVDSMPIEEELEVIEVLDGWVKIRIDNEEDAYVCSDYVELSERLQSAQSITELKKGEEEGVSDSRVDLVSYATQFVGNPYVWGGTSLTNGADCSGFTLSIYAKYGIYLPHSSAAQAGYGTRVSASEAKPGDLFFYGNGGSISHVAIYIGNGQIVHASTQSTGIKISNAFYRQPICVTRLLN